MSWAQAYLQQKHGITRSRQTLLRWADAGLIPGAHRDFSPSTRRQPRWLFTEEGLDKLAARLDQLGSTDTLDTFTGESVHASETILSLTELTAYVAEHADKPLSREAIYARMKQGQLGRRVGSQWVATRSEAQRLVESLRERRS